MHSLFYSFISFYKFIYSPHLPYRNPTLCFFNVTFNNCTYFLYCSFVNVRFISLKFPYTASRNFLPCLASFCVACAL